MDEELQALMDEADNERVGIEEASNEGEQADVDENQNQDTQHNENGGDENQNQEVNTGESVNGLDNNNSENNEGDASDIHDGLNDSGDDTANSDNNNEGNNAGNDELPDFEPIDVEVAGNKITINSQEELLQLATKGLNLSGNPIVTQSENDMYAEQGALTKEDMRLMIDAKNGDANAIARLAQIGKVDLTEIEEDGAMNYQPQFNLQHQSEVDKVASEILQDESLATTFKTVTSSLPKDFLQVISNDAQKLRAFSGHIKSGLAQEVIPQAMKQVAISGGTLIDAYAQIGSKLANQRANTRQQNPIEKRAPISAREEQMRMRANGNDKSGSSKTTKTEAQDIEDMSDEAFEKMVLNSRRN